MTTFTLPWPPAELSPNRPTHFRVTARAKKRFREACYLVAISQGARTLEMPASGPVALTITLHPPCRRQRDLDNAIAAMKAGFDGLAAALKVDDSRFTWAQPPKLSDEIGGFVRITLGAA